MDRLAMLIATGCYSGYLRPCPGTWGTLVAFPIHLLLIQLPSSLYFASLAFILLAAIISAGMAEKIVDLSDPSIVVIDEIIGMLVGLVAAPLSLGSFVIAFAIFRFFDILKPFPVGWLDRHLHGGFGIVLDDVMAGIYTLASMQLLLRLPVCRDILQFFPF